MSRTFCCTGRPSRIRYSGIAAPPGLQYDSPYIYIPTTTLIRKYGFDIRLTAAVCEKKELTTVEMVDGVF